MTEPRYEKLARHVSPDGELVLIVDRDTRADGRATIIVGFEGQPWHVHPDLFMDQSGRSWEQVGLDLAEAVMADRMLIAVSEVAGQREVRLVDHLEDEVDYLEPGQKLEFRFWSGRRVTIEDLIDGRVTFNPL